MKKILTVVGTRPQFVKVAAVSRVLRQAFHEILVDTGQHYDYKMAGVFFDELGIPKPDYQLNIGSGTHGWQTGMMLIKLEEVVIKESPDAIIVYGDTNSTLAGALVASKLHIPLFHIEAGLRSFNKKMPEEINRVVTDHVSTICFAPTETAVKNLRNEGITAEIHHVGDVMYDAVLYYWELAEKKYSLDSFQVEKQNYYLATIHRAENTDNKHRLEAIVKAFQKFREIVLLPLHPRTHKQLDRYGLLKELQNNPFIKMIEPVSYLEMLLLEKNAKGIITDSGGVQKEAYFAGIPCFTLRDETEWVETVESGWNRLVNPMEEDLSEIVQTFQSPASRKELYGDGNAAQKIVESIKVWFEHNGSNESE
ncbi:UDP-N-acetylglucosamine 2-epimerase (non-hydrolyzing) [Bacillaceae bacterium]